jgi:VWFA-related protein
MISFPNRKMSRLVILLLQLALIDPALPAQQGGVTIRAQTEIVLVNVTVRDKSGKFVRDLKPGDFKLQEDGRQQEILSFDVENVDALPALEVPQANALPTAPPSPPAISQAAGVGPPPEFRDHRLIVLFFDLSSMQPDEIDRAAAAAENYVDKQMTPADLVSVVALGSSLRVIQDFTSDHGLLRKVLQTFNAGSGQGFEQGDTGTTEGTPDTGQPFTVDDTEYNIFNNDRRLEALRSVAQKLAPVTQKKSLIYFSSGMDRTGIENQAELRATVNAAVKTNLAIYAMDIRGLQAIVPGGEAQSASLRGTAPFSGRSTLNAYDSNFSSQETLTTLAGDTGGRAFLDTNDFGQVFKGVQEDTSTYYVLGYQSSNPARDGRYRRITVSVNRPGLNLDYRRGYFAPADYQHSNKEDRERQLNEQLTSDLPAIDLTVYLATGYFRLGENRFFVPVSVVVPGSEIPFSHSADREKATLDLIGAVQDVNKQPVGRLRDTVALAVTASTQVERKNVQYNNGFILPAGKYHLKFVVRENQSGRMGSFEMDLAIPDFKSQPVRLSSVVMSNQIEREAKRKSSDNPLIRDGSEIIPNVTHVFSSGQHLYLYYEVYDPVPEPPEAGKGKTEKGQIRVLTNVVFFRGKVKAFETPLIEAREVNVQPRKATAFQLDVPLAQLSPGFYLCQVNIIDDVAGRFRFPRLALLIRK